ncbi:hypothetical protein STA1M1_08020 [Sinisalibacter aestuarii]|uniref:Uncharacterized protein n=1 Tax=Sinisalibacter aestuarii TaxID=2949426 RepID=A0ABQ5LPQ7_9RHOB|nr:hypothetical protein STA1M1_08020 [Sinisalibacter aestuarii]
MDVRHLAGAADGAVRCGGLAPERGPARKRRLGTADVLYLRLEMSGAQTQNPA